METKHIAPDVFMHLNIALTSGNKFSQKLEKALEMIGKISQHDRIYIIEVHRNMTYTLSYSWHEKSLKDLPKDIMHNNLIYDPSLVLQLCAENHMIIHESDTTSNPHLAHLLQASDCQQMLVLPLFESGSQFAFMAFLQCSATHEWSAEEIKYLRDISSIIAIQLDNHQFIKHLTNLIKQEKEARLELEIKHNHLRHWLQEVKPTWEQFKNKIDRPEISELTSLERHLQSLDKICSNTPVK